MNYTNEERTQLIGSSERNYTSINLPLMADPNYSPAIYAAFIQDINIGKITDFGHKGRSANTFEQFVEMLDDMLNDLNDRVAGLESSGGTTQPPTYRLDSNWRLNATTATVGGTVTLTRGNIQVIENGTVTNTVSGNDSGVEVRTEYNGIGVLSGNTINCQTPGTIRVYVSYKTMYREEISNSCTVSAKTVTSAQFNNDWSLSKTTAYEGDEITLNRGTIKITYNDGSTTNLSGYDASVSVNSPYTMSGDTIYLNSSGTATVTITYPGATNKTLTCTVKQDTLSSITTSGWRLSSTSPTVGSTISVSNGIVTASYQSGRTQDVTSASSKSLTNATNGNTASGMTLKINTAGAFEVTVSVTYQGKNATQKLTGTASAPANNSKLWHGIVNINEADKAFFTNKINNESSEHPDSYFAEFKITIPIGNNKTQVYAIVFPNKFNTIITKQEGGGLGEFTQEYSWYEDLAPDGYNVICQLTPNPNTEVTYTIRCL